MKSKNKKLLYLSMVFIIIVLIISLLINYFYIDNKNNDMYLISASVKMNATREEEGYIINFTHFTSAPHGNKWFKLEKVHYLLSPQPLPRYGEEHFPLGSEGGTTEEYFRALMADKDNPHNLASGKLIEILNSPIEGIKYYDYDGDLIISENDIIIINYTLIPRNLTNEKFLLDLIYIGDLDGDLSKDFFEFISYLVIDKS